MVLKSEHGADVRIKICNGNLTLPSDDIETDNHKLANRLKLPRLSTGNIMQRTCTVRLVPAGSGVTHGGQIVCYEVVTKVENKVSSLRVQYFLRKIYDD